MSKFKVGDKVKATIKDWDITKGKVYEVTGSDGYEVGVIDDVGMTNWLLTEDQWELVVELQDKPQGPFYVAPLPPQPVFFQTLEEAEENLKKRAGEHSQTTYGIFRGVKAMKLVNAVMEVPFNG